MSLRRRAIFGLRRGLRRGWRWPPRIQGVGEGGAGGHLVVPSGETRLRRPPRFGQQSLIGGRQGGGGGDLSKAKRRVGRWRDGQGRRQSGVTAGAACGFIGQRARRRSSAGDINSRARIDRLSIKVVAIPSSTRSPCPPPGPPAKRRSGRIPLPKSGKLGRLPGSARHR